MGARRRDWAVGWRAVAVAGVLACVPAAPAAARDAVVTSFDGTQIVVHFFTARRRRRRAASRRPCSSAAPYPSPGETRADEDVGDRIGLATLRAAGYNVLTWDPRGIGASAGAVMFDSPASRAATCARSSTTSPPSPRRSSTRPATRASACAGTSYGAAIQYIAAALDPRIDAIVPDVGWQLAHAALRRGGAVKTGWLAALCGLDAVAGAVDGAATDADVQPVSASDELKAVCVEGVAAAVGRQPQVARRPRPGRRSMRQIRAPALITQGTDRHAVPARPGSRRVRALRRTASR